MPALADHDAVGNAEEVAVRELHARARRPVVVEHLDAGRLAQRSVVRGLESELEKNFVSAAAQLGEGLSGAGSSEPSVDRRPRPRLQSWPSALGYGEASTSS